MNKGYIDIINHYGKTTQLRKAIEELDELAKEIIRYMDGEDNKTERLSEFADVCNMLVQLQIIWEIDSGELSEEMDKKVLRTFERMQKDGERN